MNSEEGRSVGPELPTRVIGSDYQGILNEQVENEQPQHIPKS